MDDQPPKGSKTARAKQWFDRKTDRAKIFLRVGSSSVPGSPSHPHAQSASSLPIIRQGGDSLATLQDTPSQCSPTPDPAQSSRNPTVQDSVNELVARSPLPTHIGGATSPDTAGASQDRGAHSVNAPLPTSSTVASNSDVVVGYGQVIPSLAVQGPTLGTASTIPQVVSEAPPATSKTKDFIKVSWNFTQTLLKKLPEIVDGNPIKMALSLAKTIVEITGEVKDNMDAVDQHIASAGAQLSILADPRIANWGPGRPEKVWLEGFERALTNELGQLRRLSGEGMIRKIADHEQEKAEISDIFERINEARMQFELYANIRVFKAVVLIEHAVMGSRLQELKPARMADHRYHTRGEARETLRREPCTPGTRTPILRKIVDWGQGAARDSPRIFWLFGQAGSGKTTIAFTMAKFFESAVEADGTIALGGTFFCSRQFEDTRSEVRIIPTLGYQLARKCEGFANALCQVKSFDSIDHGVDAQMRDFLLTPWHQYLSTRSNIPLDTNEYLFLVDAVDELEGEGGAAFLRDLIEAVNANHLPGINFFVTSRSNPDIVSLVESLERKELVRLQDVEEEEVRNDVTIYLDAHLPHFQGSPEMAHIKEFAGNLFICAATIVRVLTLGRLRIEDQKMLLQKFMSAKLQSATRFLDALYMELLSEAFSCFELDEELLANKLDILHAFLCTKERTSTHIVSQFLSPDQDAIPASRNSADDVLSRLYAVLYVDGRNIVLSYHKSFVDFIFDKNRSGRFACDQSSHHRLLAQHCFRIMKAGLKFNIANIPSSFLFDSQNPELPAAVQRNITPELSYACRAWCQHLSSVPCSPSDPFLAMLLDFLQLQVLFWIEAMNLLGCRGQCDPDVLRASQWVGKGDPTLVQQLLEAGSFAQHFSGSPASKSTPHIYISTLATWPHTTDVTRFWRSLFPRIPKLRTYGAQRSMALMKMTSGSSVEAVAISGDAASIVSGSSDGRVQIWDASTGEELRTLDGHNHRVTSVTISADGRRIVSGSIDHTVRIWDALTGNELRVLKGHNGYVTSVTISVDATFVVSGSQDTFVRLWDVLTGQELAVLKGHTNDVKSVAISSDATRIVSGSSDKSIRIWDVPARKELKVLKGHTHAVTSVAISADTAFIVSGSDDNSVRVWDMSTGKQLKILEGHSDAVNSVTISSNTELIVSGSNDRSIRVWSTLAGKDLRTLEGHSGSVHSVAISADATRIVSGSRDKSAQTWDISTVWAGEAVIEDTRPVNPTSISTNATPTVSESKDKAEQTGDVSTEEEKRVHDGHKSSVNSVAISADGGRIVSGSGDKSVRIWGASAAEGLKVLMVLEGHNDWVRSVAISAQARCIVSGSDDNSLRIWDALTGNDLKALKGHDNWIWSVAISIDATLIVSGSGDNSVRLWDRLTGQQLATLEGHTNGVKSVAISSDATRIVSGSSDKSIRIWDVPARKELKVLEGHTEEVNSVAISTDMAFIVSGSCDNSVRVWDMSTGKQLKVLEGHSGAVNSVAISPEMELIVSGSNDQSLPSLQAGHASFPGREIESNYIGEVVRAETSNPRYATIVPTGWILSPDKANRLMFVPPSLGLPPSPDVRITTITGRSPTVHFDDAAIGSEWANCYEPPS